jgi:hypothetical protein
MILIREHPLIIVILLYNEINVGIGDYGIGTTHSSSSELEMYTISGDPTEITEDATSSRNGKLAGMLEELDVSLIVHGHSLKFFFRLGTSGKYSSSSKIK